MQFVVRSSAYEGYKTLVTELGADPEACLRAAGVDSGLLADPDHWTRYRSFLMALHGAATATSTPHFGLLLSRKQTFAVLGAVGFAMMEAPTIHAAIDNLNRYLHLHNSGALTVLSVGRNVATWSFEVRLEDAPALTQQLDLASGIGANIMRQLVGYSWAASSVHLQHSAPSNVRPYAQLFRCPVFFNQDFTGLVFDRRVLDQRIENSNQQLFRILNSYLLQQEKEAPKDFVSLVRETIAHALHESSCSVESVAHRLALSPRTLQRRLKTQDSNFKQLLGEVRNRIAQQYLTDTSVPLTRIAVLLGYSELAAFSRSFRRDFGLSPRSWRERQANGAEAVADRT